ncbi:MAG: sugar-binding protein [Planctomycetota bacterium]
MIRRIFAVVVMIGLPSVATAAEWPSALSEADLEGIVDQAPALPVDLEHGLSVRLIDFVDFTDPDDPHEFRDQDTSRVVDGPAGTYRVTAPHRHAFFACRHRAPGPDTPMLIVIEYPDDAERVMSFMTHDSTRPGGPHLSFSLESGVYTGTPLPVTNRMQYFTFIAWSPDDWPAMIVANYGRTRGAAAASRMWVYAIDEPLPPLPHLEHSHRKLDLFVCLGFLATRDYFGHRHPQSIEHMVEYCRYVGINSVTMMVYANQTWGRMCTIPAWDSDDDGFLDNVLTQMDRAGGVELIAGIVADGMYGKTRAGGTYVADMDPDQARTVILEGLDQFIDRYGRYASLKGIALGSMEAVGFCDMLRAKGILDEVVAHILRRRPDWRVVTYLGNYRLQHFYFNGTAGEAPSAGEVVTRWEASGRDWGAFLADEVLANWRRWGRDPADLKAVEGLDVFDMYMADDHRLHPLYTQQPRAMIAYDVNNARRRSDHVDSPYGAIFSTFSEGWIGLHPEVNFWYRKDWTGPDFNPAGPYALASFARVMAHRDREVISFGTWNVKSFGYEPSLRRFAAAFHSLPPVAMAEVPVDGTDTVLARWAVREGTRTVALQSVIPMAAEVTVDGRAVEVAPYALVTHVDDAATAPQVAGKAPDAYARWVNDRIRSFRERLDAVRALDPQAAPAAYDDVARRASALLLAERPHAADLALGAGLINELELRRSILQPPATVVPRIETPPETPADLDAWPAAATDLVLDDGAYLPGHTFFPNSWSGAADLSARLRLGHDGERLHVAVRVRDQVLTPTDALTIRFSAAGYRDWRADAVDHDFAWSITPPDGATVGSGTGAKGFTYTCRRTDDGYIVEGSAPLAEMDFGDDRRLGFIVNVSDRDNTPNLTTTRDPETGQRVPRSWAQKQMLLYPHEPNFTFWSDARCFGELVLE